MSHFTRIRTQLHDLDTVRRTLEEMGYTVTEGTARGYGTQRVAADLVVKMDGNCDIGFQKTANGIVMVADVWGIRIDREEFLQQVTQRYAHITVLDQAEKQGFQVVTEETLQDGSVRLVMQPRASPTCWCNTFRRTTNLMQSRSGSADSTRVCSVARSMEQPRSPARILVTTRSVWCGRTFNRG